MYVGREVPADAGSHVGDGWFERSGMVGTAEASNSYLFQRRVVLQLKIRQVAESRCTICKALFPPPAGRPPCVHDGARLEHSIIDAILDVRCYAENDEMNEAGCRALSALAANALIGKTIAEAARMKEEELIDGTLLRTFCFIGGQGRPWLIEDAVRAAIYDWSQKATGRADRLPPEAVPKPPYRPPLWRRALRFIPFFRGLGV
jgi:hypothetical protein